MFFCVMLLLFPPLLEQKMPQVTFLFLYHLLNFGSGYEQQLQASCPLLPTKTQLFVTFLLLLKMPQVTFLCLYHLLDFGSGYEQLLQASSRRGAAETIQYGCFGLALSAKRWGKIGCAFPQQEQEQQQQRVAAELALSAKMREGEGLQT
jgi:hypothetical protein